jgi:hypothetical protein
MRKSDWQKSFGVTFVDGCGLGMKGMELGAKGFVELVQQHK